MSRSVRMPEALRALARLAGVQVSYRGFDEQVHRVDTDVVVAVLQALGIPIDRVGEAAQALAAAMAERAQQRLEPVIVLRLDDEASTVPISLPLPVAVDPSQSWLTVVLEDGETHRQRVADLLVTGRGPQRMLLAAPGLEYPPGCHEIRLEGPGLAESALLIAAPRCPMPERGWGIFSPLYALRTEDDWGVGSYRDLAELGSWVRSLGGSMVGTLPMYPTFPGEPADPSPYLPVTRLGYSELYLDPRAVPELQRAPEALALLDSPGFLERLAAARRSPLVPYEQVNRLRREALEPLAVSLGEGEAGSSLRAFTADHPELLAYARFRAVTERHGRDPNRWSASARGDLAALPLVDPAVRYHLCAQWLAFRQLGETSSVAPIYGDLPIGVHPQGFDPFFEPAAFARSAHGGAPPDAFYAEGQDWSFPPLHPVGIREQRYRHFVNVLRVAFAHTAVLRVDHVMGLHRLYWIPSGFDARHGAYVSYPADELHALVALEAHRAGVVVVGEDLGTVDVSVRKAMARDRMLRSWVMQFQTSAEDPLPEPPKHCLASFGTHDTPRFAGFWRGALAGEPNRTEDLVSEGPPNDEERARWRGRFAARSRLGPARCAAPAALVRPFDEERAALESFLAHLAASRADLVLVDLGDLIGELEQENRPGTGAGAGNWRHRAGLTLDEIRRDQGVAALVDLVAKGRAKHAPAEEPSVR